VERIKDRLARGELVLAFGVNRLPHHNLIQIVGIQGGFHAIWFDLEHGGISTEALEIGALAARSQGLDNFVRLAPTDYATITRALESGGGGIMAAQVFSAEQAEQIVQWTKFAPRGCRGLNTGGWDGQFAALPPTEFCPKANRESLVIIQIETAQSVEECDQIAAVDGVDMLFVGPSDLSQALGVTGDFFHAKCIDAIDRVAAACHRHGKHWGAVCGSPQHADMLFEKGCRLLSPTSDARVVHTGLKTVKEQYGKFFG